MFCFPTDDLVAMVDRHSDLPIDRKESLLRVALDVNAHKAGIAHYQWPLRQRVRANRRYDKSINRWNQDWSARGQ